MGKKAEQAYRNEGATELMPTVAVIISTYNAYQYLTEVLDGCLAQAKLK